jgi:hypothetical protein
LATEAKNPNKRAVAGDVFRFTPWISLIRTVLEWCRHLHTPKVRWVPQNQLMWAWNSVTILYSESTFQSGRSLIETFFSRKILRKVFPKELLPNSTLYFIYIASPTSFAVTSSTTTSSHLHHIHHLHLLHL